MTIIKYASRVTSYFNDTRVVAKIENLLKKNSRKENNKVMDIE